MKIKGWGHLKGFIREWKTNNVADNNAEFEETNTIDCSCKIEKYSEMKEWASRFDNARLQFQSASICFVDSWLGI